MDTTRKDDSQIIDVPVCQCGKVFETVYGLDKHCWETGHDSNDVVVSIQF